MNRQYKYILLFCGIVLLSLNACRKKDKRYEGYYVGTERHTYQDSGSTVLSIDTTFTQEVEVTYAKKQYTFEKMFHPPNEIFTISKKEIVDHEYAPYNSPGYLKFVGDSLYYYSTNFSDAEENWDTETWLFSGKRN